MATLLAGFRVKWRALWRLLNSRKAALYLLLGMIALLIGSTFLPSGYSLSDRELYELSVKDPRYFWLASHLSTPALVESPLFAAVTILLFLSTLACTLERLRGRFSSRTSEFSKDQTFSFSVTESSSADERALTARIEGELVRGKWERTVEKAAVGTILAGQKGGWGFWGSIIFHAGLLICFLCGPVTTLSSFRGELAVVENETVLLREIARAGKGRDALPDVEVTPHDLRAQFFQGTFREEFGGVLGIGNGTATREFPFAVNDPIDYAGYQFSLQEFGYAPRLVIERGGVVSDQFLRVSDSVEKDRFELGEGLSAVVLFFPDFIREGGKIGTRSNTPRNPVTMVRLFRGEREVFKQLFKPGESALWEGARISVPEYRRWMSLQVTREWGIYLVMLGSAVGIAGLALRFLSNERSVEFEIIPEGEGTRLTVRGYSRFYPAFLEKEVLAIAERVKDESSG